MISLKDLKTRYQKLQRKEKELIGSALVKVNLGVALPIDQRRSAEFLKGSIYIAKMGELEEVIQALQTDDDGKSSGDSEILVSNTEVEVSEEEAAKALAEHDEDQVGTITDLDKYTDPGKK